ncbi:hypothetical protein XENTR_v10013472 [Xenopus tropicalis]|nr:hypothetical protein XENTR_v10013472 [Xenopus tropicalis]KAE8600951.1 hypothetical protein XENTR_v10013472 [Xenopus tropicalis]
MDYDNSYDDLLLTEAPATRLKAVDDKNNDIRMKKSRKLGKNNQAVSTVSTSTLVPSELDDIKELINNMEETNQGNLIIFCFVMGCGLLLIIVVLLCLVPKMARLKSMRCSDEV